MNNKSKMLRHIRDLKQNCSQIQLSLDMLRDEINDAGAQAAEAVILFTDDVQPMEEAQTPMQMEAPAEKKAVEKTATAFDTMVKRLKSKWRSFTWRDIEQFVGGNLINKIGIAILVLGIGFFVKLAIDNAWLNETGRAVIGYCSGAILIVLAHRMRHHYRAFSSVLVGGGISVFFFTTYIAFQSYHLIAQWPAFAFLAGITAFSVCLSIGYNRVELAILALLGGFISPFLVSNGEDNYMVLFSYIIVLDAGMLILAWFRNWKVLTVLSFFLTAFVYGTWVGHEVIRPEFESAYIPALAFGAAFHVIFFLMSVIYNLRKDKQFNWLDFSLILVNALSFYAAGMGVLDLMDNGFWKGSFTAAMALINLAVAVPLYRRRRGSPPLLLLITGLALTFITLTAPVQLEGYPITLFWAAELVLLLWLSVKIQWPMLRYSAMLTAILCASSLLGDWANDYVFNWSDTEAIPLIHSVFVTTLFSALAFYLASRILPALKEDIFALGLSSNTLRIIFRILSVVVLYLGLMLELQYRVEYQFDHSAVTSIFIASYHWLFIAGLMCYAYVHKKHLLKVVSTIIGGVTAAGYIILNANTNIPLRTLFLEGDAGAVTWMMHIIPLAATVLIAYLVLKNVRHWFGNRGHEAIVAISALSVLALFLLSSEADHMVMLSRYAPGYSIHHILMQSHRVAWPIIWGAGAFVLMAIGMKKQYTALRIMALVLIAVTLIKLFLNDIKDVPEAGRVAAFICLGVVLLLISFLYQRLKNLILYGSKDLSTDQNSD